MKWLSNSPDYRDRKTMFDVPVYELKTHEQAWREWNEWVADKIIGPPQATEHYTVEQLEAMGLIGIYQND